MNTTTQQHNNNTTTPTHQPNRQRAWPDAPEIPDCSTETALADAPLGYTCRCWKKMGKGKPVQPRTLPRTCHPGHVVQRSLL